MRLLPKDKDVGWLPYLWLIYASMMLIFTPWQQQPRAISVAYLGHHSRFSCRFTFADTG